MNTQKNRNYGNVVKRISPFLIVIIYEQMASLMVGSKLHFMELFILYLFDGSYYFFSSLIIERKGLAINFPFLRTFALVTALIFIYPFSNWLSQGITSSLLYGKFNYKMQAYSMFVIRGMWLTGFSTFTAFYFDGIKKAKAARQAEIDKLKIEAEKEALKNAHLKAQIKPHLLFNTLNFVYAKVFEVSQEAAEAVRLLNELMKYAVDEPQPNGKVLLFEELTQVENYLSLVKLQSGTGPYFSVEIDRTGFSSLLEISPYILLTLIENVFKHGLLTDPEHPAIIHLHGKANILFLHTSNLKVMTTHTRFNVGRKYVLMLIEHAYPGRFRYEVDQSNHYYNLNLQLEL